jgi:four helix bundle protein
VRSEFGTRRALAAAMAIRDHRELKAWQFARELERRVYAFLAKSSARNDVDFCRQIRKSSSSAPRNIAVGFGRFWPAEFAHKLRIAIGELRETQDHLDKAVEEAWLAETPHGELKHLADRALGAAVRFAEYLDRNGEEWKKHYISRQRQEGKKRSDKRRAVDTHGGSQRNTPTPHRQEPSEPEEPSEL